MVFTQDQLLVRHADRMARVHEELEKRYGSRYREYRERYRLAGEFKYEPDFPLYIMLEQTYTCNLKCPTCIHGLPTEKRRFNTGTPVMPWAILEKVVLEGEKNQCPSIAFHSNDEPLLVKDLPARIRFAHDHGFMDLFMTTNGNLLNDDLIISLIEAGITRILFSVDAATDATYKQVRPNGNFQLVKKNIERLAQFKEKHSLVLPGVRVSFVVSRLNQHEIELFKETFAHLVDYIEIQGISTYYRRNDQIVPQNARHVENFQCEEPWRKLVIRPDGVVLPCCSFYGYEIPLGNVLEKSLKELFTGEQCQKMREDMKNGVFRLPACQACSKSFYKL